MLCSKIVAIGIEGRLFHLVLSECTGNQCQGILPKTHVAPSRMQSSGLAYDNCRYFRCHRSRKQFVRFTHSAVVGHIHAVASKICQ